MAYSDHALIRKKISYFIYASEALVVLTGLVVVFGWLTHNTLIVQIRPEYSPMKFNSALGVMQAGVALLLFEIGWRRAAAIVAAVAAVLPIATLLEYFFDVGLGIDDMFVQSFVQSKVHHVGRMAPNTALAFGLLDCMVILYALKPLQRFELFVVLMSSFVVALGTVPVIGYLGGIEQARTWGDFAGMSLQSALCLILLGLSLIASIWKKSETEPRWLPVPVAVGFMVIAVSIWLAVSSYEDMRFEQNMQLEADNITIRTTDRLTAFFLAVDRVAGRWTNAGGTPRNLWEPDVSNYIKAYPFLKTMEWVDENSMLQWAIPADDAKEMLGKKLNIEGTRAVTARKAEVTRTSQMTKSVDFIQGGKGFLYMTPVYVQDKFNGFMVAAFTLDYIYDRILAREKTGPYYLTVREGDTIVYSNAPESFVPSERWQKSANVTVKDDVWTVSVSPAPTLFAQKNSALPALVFITGMLSAVFATFAVLAALRARRDEEQLRVNEARLQQIIKTYSILGMAKFDLQALMDTVVQSMETLTPSTGSVIELVEGDEMYYGSTSGSLTVFKNYRIPRAGSLSGLCVGTGAIMISADTSKDPRVNAEACRKVGANSMVVVPLIQRGAVVAVLKVVSTRPNAFAEKDIGTLQLVAGLLGGALGQQLEIERREKVEEQLRQMAHYDKLTGLPNRILFQDRLSQAILHNARHGKMLAVMYMDIDHFKAVNDTYGHAEGDTILQEFAARTSRALRKTDTLARLGGDEFILIAQDLHGIPEAESIAQKIIVAMSQPFILGGTAHTLGVSIGVAVATEGQIKPDDIVARADEALYESKRGGRGRFNLVKI